MKIHVYVLSILLLILFSVGADELKKLDVAVSDLTGKGIDLSAAAIISDRLRSDLITTGVFRVMERSEMNSILKEQGFQQTGACDDQSCVVEVGQLLGVHRMIAGTVGKIGSLYTISLRVINVVTGQILMVVNEDYDGEIKGVLSYAIGNAAKKLSRIVETELNIAATLGKQGDLYISSIPSGANIEIDGEIIAGQTPISLQGIITGEHRIVVRNNEYYGAERVTLLPDDLLKVNIVMNRGNGSLKIFTTPDSAFVYIDDEQKATSPCKLGNIPACEHRLTIRKQGYLTYTTTIQIGVDQAQSISIPLVPAANISVFTKEKSARIKINNVEIAQGEISSYIVKSGDVEVAIELAGFEPWSQTIHLNQGEHKTIDVQLVSVFGELSVNSEPQGAQIFLNENAAGATPYINTHLHPDRYMIRVVLNNYETIRETVEINKNLTTQKNYTLEHTQAFLDSLKHAKIAAKTRGQLIRRIAFGCIAAGFSGIGIYYEAQAQQFVKDQETIQDAYQTATTDFESYQREYDNKIKDAEQSRLMRNLFFVMGSLFACGFTISIPF